MRKFLPNLITCLRILVSPLLLIFSLPSVSFAICYAVCGTSDIADGLIARKFKCESKFGEHFDSIADVLFFGIAIYRTVTAVRVPTYIYVVAAVTLLVRVVCFICEKQAGYRFTMHTNINKALGVLLFLVPLTVFSGNTEFTSGRTSVTAFLSLVAAVTDLTVILKTNNHRKREKSE